MQRTLSIVLLGMAMVAVACGDDETKGGAATTATATSAASTTGGGGMGGDGGAGGSAPTCGPAELCARTIDECMETITPQQCADFYANDGNCTDMDAYVTCNCDCYAEATCDDYFACGNLCFNDHCQ